MSEIGSQTAKISRGYVSNVNRHLFLSSSEAGTFLGFSAAFIVRLCEAGKLTAFHDPVSGWQVDRESAEAYLLRLKTTHQQHATEEDLLA
jgi:hypothetical protein